MTHCVQASYKAIHREPHRPKGASSLDFISHTHLQALSRVTSQALFAAEAGAAETGNIWHENPTKFDTIRMWGKNLILLCLFPPN